MKNSIVILVIFLIILSCDNKSTSKEDVCSSNLFKRVENLLLANEYIVNTEDYYRKPELKKYLNILKDIKDFKYEIIVASGGIKPENNELAYGCKKGDENYFEIYQSSAISSLVKEIDISEDVNSFDEIFNSNLIVNFNDKYLYTKSIFSKLQLLE